MYYVNCDGVGPTSLEELRRTRESPLFFRLRPGEHLLKINGKTYFERGINEKKRNFNKILLKFKKSIYSIIMLQNNVKLSIYSVYDLRVIEFN